MSGTLWTFNSLNVTLYSLDSVLILLSLLLNDGVLLIGVVDILSTNLCQEESINGAPPSKQTPQYLYLRSMPEKFY
jgi:hypothetical protein